MFVRLTCQLETNPLPDTLRPETLAGGRNPGLLPVLPLGESYQVQSAPCTDRTAVSAAATAEPDCHIPDARAHVRHQIPPRSAPLY